MKGFVHIYYGDGKGKTTCAMGLGVRAAGRGFPVTVAQFLKSEDSGERDALKRIPLFDLLPLPEEAKFTFAMNDDELEETKDRCRDLFRQGKILAESRGGLLILDEVFGAINAGMLSEQELADYLDHRPEDVEIILTGRAPGEEILRRADYVTEMKKIRHPMETGVSARVGIEF